MEQLIHSKACRNGEFFWTKPYFGVMHCGEFGSGNCWVSVSDYNTFSVLDKYDWRKDTLIWHPTEYFGTSELAKKEAEKWMRLNGY